MGRRTIGRLTARQVANAKPKGGRDFGYLADGGNLLLQVSRGKEGGIRKSWVLRYQLDGKRHEMGLGSANDFSLAEARERARAQRQLLADGVDPLNVKRDRIEQRKRETKEQEAALAKRKTFREVAELFLAKHSDSWGNAKHRAQWRSTLAQYANPVIGHLYVGDVDTPHVIDVLAPLWSTRRVTARRLLGRIERVIDFAKSSGYRDGENPARWREHLRNLLPAERRQVEHHKALPYGDVPAFMLDLRDREGLSARALEFLALTCVRSGSARGAVWDEISLKEKVWVIPATRMKGKVEHKVPLVGRALEILNKLPHREGLVFPGSQNRPMKDFTLLKELRELRPDATVHGFRSAARTWMSEQTNFPHEVCEATLAHKVPDAVVRAYRRTDFFDRRRKLMEAWDAYCSRPAPAGATVVPMRMGAGHG
jgi:integrase